MTIGKEWTDSEFKEQVEVVLGLNKGFLSQMAISVTKETVIDSLKEEMTVVGKNEQLDYQQMIRFIQQMTESEFSSFYENLPLYELINGEIVEQPIVDETH